MADRKVSEMTGRELRSSITYGVFVGQLGIVAIATILVLMIAAARGF